MPNSHKPHRPPHAATGGYRAPAHGGHRHYRGGSQERPNATTRGYDWEWYNLAKQHREMYPACERCGAHPPIKANGEQGKHIVDHVVPVRVEPMRRLDPSNCETLCRSCHGIKTEEDKRKYPEAYGRKPIAAPALGVPGGPRAPLQGGQASLTPRPSCARTGVQ